MAIRQQQQDNTLQPLAFTDTTIHLMLRAQWAAAYEMLHGLMVEASARNDQDAARRIGRWMRVTLAWRRDLDRSIAPEDVSSFPPYLPTPEQLRDGER